VSLTPFDAQLGDEKLSIKSEEFFDFDTTLNAHVILASTTMPFHLCAFRITTLISAVGMVIKSSMCCWDDIDF
jgi:hypothetical protein